MSIQPQKDKTPPKSKKSTPFQEKQNKWMFFHLPKFDVIFGMKYNVSNIMVGLNELGDVIMQDPNINQGKLVPRYLSANASLIIKTFTKEEFHDFMTEEGI